VTLVAVSKTVPAARVQAAVAAGLVVLGENRVQEAAVKIPEVVGAAWHLLGSLQANKARRAVELFDVLEAVGSLELARRLDRIAGEVRPGRPLPVLLQVNVADDPAKSGFDEAGVAAAIAELVALPCLRVDGLMTIGRLVPTPEAARPTFRALRELSSRLRAAEPRLGPALSMGMSDDYAVAVEEGATIVRVGRQPSLDAGGVGPHGLRAALRRRVRHAPLGADAGADPRDVDRPARDQPGIEAAVPDDRAAARSAASAAAQDRRLRRGAGPHAGRARPALAADPVTGQGAARISVRLTPRGGADRVDGVVDGVLRVRVAAPAVDGAANRAMLRLLADELGVPRGAVSLVVGAGNRSKVVEVDGVDPSAVAARWPGLRG